MLAEADPPQGARACGVPWASDRRHEYGNIVPEDRRPALVADVFEAFGTVGRCPVR